MKPSCSQRGVTLIELLISVTIGLVLATAASYLFVSTQRSSKVLDAQQQQQETASIVMDMLGRDLKNAGFFPASFPTTTATVNVRGGYTNVVDATKPAFDQGIFGCSRAVFNPTTGLCPSAGATSEPDSVVVNYFTTDNFVVEGIGNRKDCLRNSVEAATFNATAYNAPRAGAGSTYTTTVALPVLVSNVYSLGSSANIVVDNQTIAVRSFRCAGNGSANVHQPLFAGVEQMRIKFGTTDGTTQEAPNRYYTAAEVTGLGTAVIAGEPKTGWQRVVAVQVCLLTKTIDSSARQKATGGSYVDCDGTTVNYVASDRALYQRQVRIFGLRNNLTASF